MSYRIEQQKKANENLESIAVRSRLEDRLLWDKILTLILAILGFSLTLFSTEFFSLKIECSYSKYLLVISWLTYCLSLLIGFILLKRETQFQKNESFRNSLYAMDTFELLNDDLDVREGKKEHFIALQVLRGKSVGKNSYWSTDAIQMYEKHKAELNSYQLAGNPEKLFSPFERKVITLFEKIFYILVVLATLLFIISVSIILI